MNTTPATLAQDTTNLRRGTYKSLGSPVRFYYWGTQKNANDEDGALVVSVKVDGTKITMASAREVRTIDARTRIWISDEAPVVVETEVTKAVKRAAKPSRNAKLHDCKCGCGQQVKGLYKQGHDARHASDVAKRVIALLASDPDVNLADPDLFDELPTQALKAKAAAIVVKRITK